MSPFRSDTSSWFVETLLVGSIHLLWHTRTRSLTYCLSLSLSLSLTHCLSRSRTHCLFRSLSHCLFRSLSHCLSRSLSHIQQGDRTRSHIIIRPSQKCLTVHTHTLSLSLSHTHTRATGRGIELKDTAQASHVLYHARHQPMCHALHHPCHQPPLPPPLLLSCTRSPLSEREQGAFLCRPEACCRCRVYGLVCRVQGSRLRV